MTYCGEIVASGILANGAALAGTFSPQINDPNREDSPHIKLRLEMIVSRFLHCHLPVNAYIGIRTLSTTSQSPSSNNALWLSETKSRLGKLFFHGTTAEEVKEASVILKDLTKNWREYVAASEGFLTGEKWRGLYKHNVVWGDMVLQPPPQNKNVY